MAIVGKIDLYSQFKKYIDGYENEITEELRKQAQKTAKEGKELIRYTAPESYKKYKTKKHYVETFIVKRSEKGSTNDVVLWNRNYRLSHLIERNHRWSNQWGTRTGWTKKNVIFPWKKTEEFMINDFYERAITTIEKINKKRSKK